MNLNDRFTQRSQAVSRAQFIVKAVDSIRNAKAKVTVEQLAGYKPEVRIRLPLNLDIYQITKKECEELQVLIAPFAERFNTEMRSLLDDFANALEAKVIELIDGNVQTPTVVVESNGVNVEVR